MESNTPSERMLYANWELMQAAAKGGIYSIIQTAGTIFDCPILLVDDCFRLICTCPDGPLDNPHWNTLLNKRSLDIDLMWKILLENISDVEGFYKPFYTNRGLCKKYPILMGELLHNKTIYGHLIICLGDHPLQADDLALTSLLLYVLQLHLNTHKESIDHWNHAMSTRLQDLLLLDTPKHLVELSVKTLSSNLTGRFAILVTPFGQQASQQAFAHLAVMRLQQMYRNVVTLTFENAIVTLFGGIQYSSATPILRPENNAMAEQLFSFFEQYNMKSGLSNSFQDLHFALLHYHQALFSAQLAISHNQEERAIFMDQMPLPLFSALLRIEPGRIFIHPVIYQIRSYDLKHGTDYEQTLRMYFLSMRNKEEAAKHLNIHKNTLQYRLNRIIDLFDLPLDDTLTSLNLLCTSLLLTVDPSLGERRPPHDDQKPIKNQNDSAVKETFSNI